MIIDFDQKIRNTDKFRGAALYFKEHGYYTSAPKGTSAYLEYWNKEKERCLYGYTAEDGDYITGYHYWYLNYCQIILIKEKEYEQKDGSKAKRVMSDRDFPRFYDYDRFFFLAVEEAERQGKHLITLKSRRKGYEQPYSEPVATPNGFKSMGSLKVGDEVLTIDGSATKINEIYEQGYSDVFEVTFKDGRKVRTGNNHLWTVVDKFSNNIREERVISTRDMYQKGLYRVYNGYNHYRYYINPIQAINYSTKNLPIDPYLLGALLGDGNLTKGNLRFASVDRELIDKIQSILGDEYELKYDKTTPCQYNISIKKEFRFHEKYRDHYDNGKYGVNPLRREIDKLGLNVSCFYKHIPSIYKQGSIEQRWELVRGLLDTDGSVNTEGAVEFSNTSEDLIEDLKEVLRSLGVKCNSARYECEKDKSFIFRLYIHSNDQNLFFLERKKKRLNNKKRFDQVPIIDIKPLGYAEKSRCISVDHPSKMYLTKNYVPTHNSYKVAAMLTRNFYLIPSSKGYALASEMEYLVKDGILSKAWSYLDFIDENTAWIKRRHKADTKMHKRASFITEVQGTPVEMGYKSEIMGITLKNDPQKSRGKCFGRGTNILMADGSLKEVQNIKIGDLVMGPDSTPRTVKAVHSGIDQLYKIKPSNGSIQIVNSNHDIYTEYFNWNYSKSEVSLLKPEEFISLSDAKKYRAKLVKKGVEYTHREVKLDPYFLGLWLGDGSVGKTEIVSMDVEILEYLREYAKEIGGSYYSYPRKTNDKVISIGITGGAKGRRKNYIKNQLVSLGILRDKFIPKEYLINSKEVRYKLLAGIVDSDGYLDVQNGRIEITQKRKNLAEDIVYLCRSLGIKTSIAEKYIPGYGIYYRMNLLNSLEFIPTKVKRKQAVYKNKLYVRNPLHSNFTIEKHTIDYYYGFTVDKDNLFLLGDFTVSHNSGKLIIFEEAGKFPNLKTSWQVSRPSVEQGGYVHGLQLAFGTGGTASSDFEGLKELFEEPDAYNCLPIPDVWDKEAPKDKIGGFFVPAWANMEGEYFNLENPEDPDNGKSFMDSDGNSNKELALKFILRERKKVIENASDRNSIDRHVAEICITPVEATLNLSANIFPKQDLIRHLAYIRNNKAVREFKQVGDLYFDENGLVKWKQAKVARDITKYRLNPNDDPRGQIVIWEHPVDNPPFGLYIGGADTYDHDQASSGSLGSAFIFKRFQTFESYYDLPVAEYTGRPDTADEFYENVRKLLLYYKATALYENEKKGMYAYFANKHAEHLLADQPGIINDIIKDSKVERRKGIHMNKPIKEWMELKIRDWLIEEYDEGKKNLTKIFSEPLLEELISYNDTGNFDRVISMGLCIIYREELYNVHVKKAERESKKSALFDGHLDFNKDINYFNL